MGHHKKSHSCELELIFHELSHIPKWSWMDATLPFYTGLFQKQQAQHWI